MVNTAQRNRNRRSISLQIKHHQTTIEACRVFGKSRDKRNQLLIQGCPTGYLESQETKNNTREEPEFQEGWWGAGVYLLQE